MYLKHLTQQHSRFLSATVLALLAASMAAAQSSGDLREAVLVDSVGRAGFTSVLKTFVGRRTVAAEVVFVDSLGRRLEVGATVEPLAEREDRWQELSLTNLAVPLREEAPSGFGLGSQVRITEIEDQGGAAGFLVAARFEGLMVRVFTRDRSDGKDLAVFEAVARYALAGAYGTTLKADGTVALGGRQTQSYRSPEGVVFVRLDEWASARDKALTWNRADGRASFDAGAGVVVLAAPSLKVGGRTRPVSGIVALKDGHWLVPLEGLEGR